MSYPAFCDININLIYISGWKEFIKFELKMVDLN